jgi:hypothetical protein
MANKKEEPSPGAKVDLRKTLGPLYLCPAGRVTEVKVAPAHFLMVDGVGDPHTAPAYARAVEALFTLAYALKFALKKGAVGIDFAVMPLEGLWWSDDMSSFAADSKKDWKWTMMIRQQPEIDPALFEAARSSQKKKKKPNLDLEGVRFDSLNEGFCSQILHIGPFSTEGPTVKRLHEAITEQGKRLRGKHHEIYLSDIRKVAPEKWRPIIRQPYE